MTDDRIERLQRRLERERAARVEAESIAERGLRELFLANRDLDRRIEERTAELEAAREHEEAASRERARMLAWLSRHVRAPLNGVIGMLELLGDQAATDQTREWVGSASTSADDLLRIFSRLILFVELEQASDPVAVDVDVADLTRELRQRWTRPAISHGKLLIVEDHTPSETSVTCVQNWLERLIDEAVDNAVRHAEPGPLRVDIDTIGARLRVDITDAGPGITDPDRLLTGGTEILSPTEDIGIGFPLMGRLATALGATVEVRSTPPSPTTVEIELAR